MQHDGYNARRKVAVQNDGLACRPRICAAMPAGALFAAVLAITLLAPIAIDNETGLPGLNSAAAASGDGNFGKGKGNGGANGQNPGKSGGNGTDDDGNNVGEGQNPVSPGGGDSNERFDDSAEEIDIESPAGAAAAAGNGQGNGADSVGIPTVVELFSLGSDGIVSAEEELELISNGWNAK